MKLNKTRLRLFTILISAAILLINCTDKPKSTPRPYGYMRIDFPEKEYLTYTPNCPYKFDYSKWSLIDTNRTRIKTNCGLNLFYPRYGASIHLTYFKIEKDSLYQYIEDAHKMAMRHTVRADDIRQRYYENKENNTYGIAYEFDGNVATNFQFFLTDSNNHFLRGALYFNMRPNPDSLAPVISFISEDLYKVIETLEWRDK